MRRLITFLVLMAAVFFSNSGYAEQVAGSPQIEDCGGGYILITYKTYIISQFEPSIYVRDVVKKYGGFESFSVVAFDHEYASGQQYVRVYFVCKLKKK